MSHLSARRWRLSPRLLVIWITLLGTGVFLSRNVSAQPPNPCTGCKNTGWWSGPHDWSNAGIHTFLTRGNNDGTYGSHSQVVTFYSSPVEVWKWDPTDYHPVATDMFEVQTDDSDIFCSGHSALADGRVLVTGGNEGSSPGLDHTNIYNPFTAPPSFAARPNNMYESRWYPTNTSWVNSGTFEVVATSGLKYFEMSTFGGYDGSGTSQNSSDIFGMRGEPVRVAASAPSPLPPARYGHSIVFDNSNASSGTDVSFKPNMKAAIYGGRASSGSNPLGDVWRMSRTELATWSWTEVTPIDEDPDPLYTVPDPRADHSAVFRLSTKSMIIFGGVNASGTALDDVWELILNPTSGNPYWKRIVASGGSGETLARSGHCAVYDASQNRILVFGGKQGSSYPTKVKQLSLSGSPAWTELTATGPSGREGHVGDLDTKLNRMIIFGGADGSNNLNREVWALSLTGNSWSQLSTTAGADGFPATRTEAAGIYDAAWDRLLIFGGDTNGSTSGGVVSDVWDLPLGLRQWDRTHASISGADRAGHTAVFERRGAGVNAILSERFIPGGSGTWNLLSNAPKWLEIYPFMFVLPISGKILFAGPRHFTFILDPAGQGSWTQPTWSPSNWHGGTAVMYVPGKVMKCGATGGAGHTHTMRIDLSSSETPAQGWTEVATNPQDRLLSRCEHNLTIVPTGRVIVTGGLDLETNLSTAEKRVQVWDPTSEKWTVGLAPDPAIRNYHSTALLLPNGTILSTGGDDIDNPYQPNPLKTQATIYWPPYLFKSDGTLATRPEITTVDTTLSYGEAFYVCTPASNITMVNLVKPGAVTHQFNQDQRFVPLSFTYSGSRLRVTAPANDKMAPPGDYMLFIVTQDSVPSIASWVRLKPVPTCSESMCGISGSITTQTWGASNAPHVVSGDVTIPAGETLTIDSGMQISMIGSGTEIIVEGSLIVNGTAASKVKFVSNKCVPQEGEPPPLSLTPQQARQCAGRCTWQSGSGGHLARSSRRMLSGWCVKADVRSPKSPGKWI